MRRKATNSTTGTVAGDSRNEHRTSITDRRDQGDANADDLWPGATTDRDASVGRSKIVLQPPQEQDAPIANEVMALQRGRDQEWATTLTATPPGHAPRPFDRHSIEALARWLEDVGVKEPPVCTPGDQPKRCAMQARNKSRQSQAKPTAPVIRPAGNTVVLDRGRDNRRCKGGCEEAGVLGPRASVMGARVTGACRIPRSLRTMIVLHR